MAEARRGVAPGPAPEARLAPKGAPRPTVGTRICAAMRQRRRAPLRGCCPAGMLLVLQSLSGPSRVDSRLPSRVARRPLGAPSSLCRGCPSSQRPWPPSCRVAAILTSTGSAYLPPAAAQAGQPLLRGAGGEEAGHGGTLPRRRRRPAECRADAQIRRRPNRSLPFSLLKRSDNVVGATGACGLPGGCPEARRCVSLVSRALLCFSLLLDASRCFSLLLDASRCFAMLLVGLPSQRFGSLLWRHGAALAVSFGGTGPLSQVPLERRGLRTAPGRPPSVDSLLWNAKTRRREALPRFTARAAGPGRIGPGPNTKRARCRSPARAERAARRRRGRVSHHRRYDEKIRTREAIFREKKDTEEIFR